MTEPQRDYLADLANKKGVRIENTDEMSVAQASAKIDELKAMPDAVFDEVTEKQLAEVERRTGNILANMNLWGFN